jgi:predicted RecA/RadA family phage recombinase
MAANREKNGKRITFDPGATVVSGQVVVVGTLLVVCLVDGVSGTLMEGAIKEVYRLNKLDAAVIAQGDPVDFDVSADGGLGQIDDSSMTPAAGDLSNCGIAMEGKGATTGETILVDINAAGLATAT